MLLFYWMMLVKGEGKGKLTMVHKFAVKFQPHQQQYFIKCNPMDEEFYVFLEEELLHVFRSLQELDTWIHAEMIS